MDVAGTILQPDRKWIRNQGATSADISLLESRARAALPQVYLELLRFSNGGEGPLALPPRWFQLYSVTDCIELCHSGSVLQEFPDFMFFGSNGGLESIAFDLREGPPWPIVALDQIAGISSAQRIAANMSEFIQAIGVV